MKIYAHERLQANFHRGDFVVDKEGRLGKVTDVLGTSVEVQFSGGLRGHMKQTEVTQSKRGVFKPTPQEAKALFNRFYRTTHKDSKGTFNGKKAVMGFGPNGSRYILEEDFVKDPELIFRTIPVYEVGGKYK